ncbi:SelT/SelW/SelH family protein [Marinilongibacter aquaticus]|uniref:SelT/SelW/SelH family protein n=1 Tax=Marinilongibacter aquaticus TaxID=2975157 RepID=UPI0021BD120D|nr:SelT/SelW/SelH family protein [Marinilongibacter aquaticus]UBM58823.1 SelT/SelW/SelH family protein [Marinilongibacter aquaticus]
MKITIIYCPKCGWLLRSAWMAQELLTTFGSELSEVSLKPSLVGGVFQIYADSQLIFDRKTYGGFPEPKTLKQIVRDAVSPDMNLGHADVK